LFAVLVGLPLTATRGGTLGAHLLCSVILLGPVSIIAPVLINAGLGCLGAFRHARRRRQQRMDAGPQSRNEQRCAS
jgi:hypothetical protein